MVRNSPFIFCIFVLLRNPMFFCMWFWWMQSFFNAVIKFVVTKHKIQRNSLPTIKLKKGILTGLFQIDPQPPSNFSVIPHGRMFNLNCVIQIEQDSELEGNNDHIFGWIMNLPQSPVQKPLVAVLHSLCDMSLTHIEEVFQVVLGHMNPRGMKK